MVRLWFSLTVSQVPVQAETHQANMKELALTKVTCCDAPGHLFLGQKVTLEQRKDDSQQPASPTLHNGGGLYWSFNKGRLKT